MADASSNTAKYFVTASIVYLSAVNLIMPVLTGFVLPIVLAKLMHLQSQSTIPSTLPVTTVPVNSASSTTVVTIPDASPIDNTAKLMALQGAANFLGLFANPMTYAIANRISSTGITTQDSSATAASGLSAKDIINIATALVGTAAKVWDYVQQDLCASDSQ